MHRPHEFVCADCKSNVFSYGGLDPQTRCASCEVVAELREERGLSPEDEAELRKLLGCELPKSQTGRVV
jgi:hypothetical protein